MLTHASCVVDTAGFGEIGEALTSHLTSRRQRNTPVAIRLSKGKCTSGIVYHRFCCSEVSMFIHAASGTASYDVILRKREHARQRKAVMQLNERLFVPLQAGTYRRLQ